MKITKLIAMLFLASIFFASCSSDDSPQGPRGDYDNGLLVSGEGSGAGSGSVSYVSDDYKTVESKIFKKVNDSELGTFLQSMSFDNNNAYIVVDNANTINVVDRYTFKAKGKIIDKLVKPRYVAVVGNKAYATNWGATDNSEDDFVAVIDLNTNTVTETIAVDLGPERIIERNGKLYVTHQGAFGTNNIVSVIDIASKSVTKITVKDRPDELFFDNSGQLVVLCQGKTIYDASWNVIGHTEASISKINTSNNTVSSELVFPEGQHPSLMVLEGDTIYYALSGKIYAMSTSSASLPTTALLEGGEAYLYGFDVEDGKIYTVDASFTDVSKLNIYDLSSKNKLDTKDVSIGASKIYFN